MKMRNYFKSALLASAFIVGFASCSNDDEIGGADLGDAVQTMVQVAITQSGPATYAGSATATTEESAVNKVELYIFNKSKVLEAVEKTTFATGTAETMKFKLTKGIHYFYAAINAPDNLLTSEQKAIGVTLDSFKKNLTKAFEEGELNNPANGFFMTNVTNEPVLADLVETEDPQDNDVQISVGRAMAKVNVAFKPESQGVLGKLSNVQYKVHNNPIKMYFMPFYESGVLQTPFFTDEVGEDGSGTITSANYFPNLQYSGEQENTDKYLKEDFEKSFVSYAIENSNAVPREGNSTFLMIRGTYTPAKTFDGNGENEILDVNGNTTGDSFWRIKATDGTFTDKFYRDKPTTTVADGGLAFKYENGLSYYALWVGDNSIEKNPTAKYTVKRNNFYKVTITSVSGPGANTENGKDEGEEGVTDPKEELDAKTQIQATITVLPWTVIDQSGGI